MISRISTVLVAILACLPTLTTAASNTATARTVQITNSAGQTVAVYDDRQPALYTTNYGNCLAGSSINLTRFDIEYYADNMTVNYHFAGSTDLTSANIMMYIGFFAFGETRFDLIVNPCSVNITSLCPASSSVPIQAAGTISVDQAEVADIPSLAYSVPDVEGQAILRIFDNATRSEIACYTGDLTNGNSFSQPAAVGTVLGIFTVVALIASFATAIYGEAVPTMRLHYAHSLSVGVVFAVFQHIFFTGALSVNWPPVLVAWWSNFAWAGGMIYSASMQNSINSLIGNNMGNTSETGAAQTGSSSASLAGGFALSAIYKRSGITQGGPLAWIPRDHIAERMFGRALKVRAATSTNITDDYTWGGHFVNNGFPLPGNFSGFAGTLAEEGILVSNAFMTGFLWFLILLVILVAAVVAFKWSLEAFVRIQWMKPEALKFFREQWLRYTAQVALRTCLVAFFAMMFLTIFEFTYNSSGGVKAIAAIVFILFFVGIFGAAAYAIHYQMSHVHRAGPTVRVERNTFLKRIPWLGKMRTTQSVEAGPDPSEAPPNSKSSANPFWKRTISDGSVPVQDQRTTGIHDSEDFIMKFGWLAARFRRTRWWFFAAWLFYEFVRAIFYGGASGYALAQVFGLLVIEVIAFVFFVWVRPFEGQRLNILVVYGLSFSKILTIALSAAFDVQFNVDRITTTIIGLVIITIQGLLTIATVVAIIAGAVSSYMSLSRNQEEIRPRKWLSMRERYFDHLDRTVNDLPAAPKPKPQPKPVEEEFKTGFEMKNIRRVEKIDDDDAALTIDGNASSVGLHEAPQGTARRQSMRSMHTVSSVPGTPARSRPTSAASNLPYGARPHRQSWSARDVDFAAAEREAQEQWSSVDVRIPTQDDAAAPTPGSSTDPIPSQGRKRSWSMKKSVTAASSSSEVKPQVSQDNLRVGGAISTPDTIGLVPAPPTLRSRSGTQSSRHSRNSFTSFAAEASNSSDHVVAFEGSDPQGSLSKRASMSARTPMPLLTPTQEMDEWAPSSDPTIPH